MIGKCRAKLPNSFFVSRIVVPGADMAKQSGTGCVGGIPNEDIEFEHDIPPEDSDLIAGPAIHF